MNGSDRQARRQRIRQAFDLALSRALEFEAAGDLAQAWAQLERAHILGQQPTVPHLRSHLAMLGLARRVGDRREMLGQLLRLAGALLVTWIWVPRGNTGRSNISAFRSLPLPADLAEIID